MNEPDRDPNETDPPAADPFPSTDFDPWAETYDHDVVTENVFPFDGYERALDTVVSLAAARRGMSVLDLGTGTGNLVKRFAALGCELWGTDFSQRMLDQARLKLPSARLIRHDLRQAWPVELDRRFDRIVSAYVFHHFDLVNKVKLCRELVTHRLQGSGRLILADISFRDAAAMNDFARSIGEAWEAEPYWLADEAIPALREAGLEVEYKPVAACAGVYRISPIQNLHAGE